VIKNPPDACLPVRAESQIVLFDYIKAWNLGGNLAEDQVEEMLKGWKDVIISAIKGVSLTEHVTAMLKDTKITPLH
jgi:hypothetical protein